MKRERLIDEAWREEVREEIIACVVMREEEPLRDECKSECDFYPICKRVLELENVEAKKD